MIYNIDRSRIDKMISFLSDVDVDDSRRGVVESSGPGRSERVMTRDDSDEAGSRAKTTLRDPRVRVRAGTRRAPARP
jgi:hypothetical protein